MYETDKRPCEIRISLKEFADDEGHIHINSTASFRTHRPSPARAKQGVVAHWGTKYNLHWQVDLTFGDDQRRLRKGHSDGTSESIVGRL